MRPGSPAPNTRPHSSLTTCAGCRHFQPDPLNPPAGMGRCLHPARHGYWHALAEHRCRDHEPKPEAPVDD